MAKYINRDQLLEAYGNCIVTYVLQPKNGTFPTYGETALWDYIETMPTIEAEPIVRCKDCKYCITHEKILFCEYMGNIGDWRFRTETDFCSRGAKMDEVEE